VSFDRKASAGYLANHMARLFAQRLHERIRPLGLAPAQFAVLLELWEEDGLTQGQLVRRLAVEQATMANTLLRMERDGLITREPHPRDRRASVVRITRHALDLKEPATAAAASVNRQALDGLDAEAVEGFVETMRRAIAALEIGRS
jgi:DNA-binding MarR family transcriptional regulator